MAEVLTLFGKPAARASSPAAPSPRAVAAGRARPEPEVGGRPLAMELLGIPLNGLQDSALAELDKLGPGWTWGRDEVGNFFVERPADDSGRPGSGDRCIGRSLLGAVKVAQAAQRILAGGDQEDEQP